jgi:rRNA-processing protein FCF1
MKVILDTSFIMDCFRYRIDFAEIFDLTPGARIATIPQVVEELKRLAGKKSTQSRYAKVAVSLIDGLEILEAPEGKTDDALVEIAGKEIVVATNDENLRKRIAKRGLKTIYLRGRKHLAVS